MQTANTVSEARVAISNPRQAGSSIGFVPTMGALHEGHLSLIRRARAECAYVVVSIFVNPTQFGPGEDYDRYPRTLDQDLEKCRSAGVDLVFVPSASEMYPSGFDSWVEVKGLITEDLEGAFRPGHFRGVTTVCAKLFNIVNPHRAYFGMKDYQQLKVIQKMVRDLNMPIEIVPCETVREPDGLAMSSRNSYLSGQERRAAVVLSRSLDAARDAFAGGQKEAGALENVARQVIETEPLARIDYVAIRDAENLEPIRVVDRSAVLLLAVRIGDTRLIDNCLLKPA
ncbi:MAG: pantoate--beta-alanine ligase [Armatimonadota bacterium]|nr:pantoate--beta-alanine ligase [Armatimonadota bacterium]